MNCAIGRADDGAFDKEKRDMLFSALKDYCPNAVPMHMPGHMRNGEISGDLKALCAGIDITEIDGFDDLHHPSGILRRSMEMAEKLWKSDHTRYLVNGSTCGILSAVYALGAGGGRIVCARNAHKSFYHALEITDLEPVFVQPGFDVETGACLDVSVASIKQALDQTPDAKFVFLTSPTYEGVISDIKGICGLAHKRGIPVIVDEAHGAHLSLTRDFPCGAVEAGADIVIESVHKTLLSLTQTAVMHISGNLVSIKDIDHALDIFETSSPSYLLMASIDSCVEILTEKKEAIFSAWRENLEAFRSKAQRLKNIRIWTPHNAFCYDMSKIILMHPALTGNALMEILRNRFSIELEAAYPRYCVAMTGAGVKKEMLDALFSALEKIDSEEFSASDFKKPAAPARTERVYSIKTALQMPFECVKLKEAAGRIAAEYAWAYPPGIPVLAPGERITENMISVWNDMIAASSNTITTRSSEGLLAVVKE